MTYILCTFFFTSEFFIKFTTLSKESVVSKFLCLKLFIKVPEVTIRGFITSISVSFKTKTKWSSNVRITSLRNDKKCFTKKLKRSKTTTTTTGKVPFPT